MSGFDSFDVENERQRFYLWAANIGLYYPGHSSLDYRLRDNALIRDFVIDLLSSLKEKLFQCQLLLSSVKQMVY